LLYAGLHQKFFGYYRALSKRFPYAIYYQVNGETVEVWRILDCRQNPERIPIALKAGK
jgi:plasmid stabilization system protein ParE